MAIDMNRTQAKPSALDLVNNLQSDIPSLIGEVTVNGSLSGPISDVITRRLEDIKSAINAS